MVLDLVSVSSFSVDLKRHVLCGRVLIGFYFLRHRFCFNLNVFFITESFFFILFSFFLKIFKKFQFIVVILHNFEGNKFSFGIMCFSLDGF